MQVLPPRENSDFRFRLSLSEARAYVGQPLTLTATWYIGREVQEFSFTVPLLEDGRFEILEPPERDAQAQADVMEIRLGDRRALARKGTADLDGRRVTTLAFEKVLIPRAAGGSRAARGNSDVRDAAARPVAPAGSFRRLLRRQPLLRHARRPAGDGNARDPLQRAASRSARPALVRTARGLQRLDRGLPAASGRAADLRRGRRAHHARTHRAGDGYAAVRSVPRPPRAAGPGERLQRAA